ncbi:membrane protein [Marivirga tractuosa]|uniref:AsmA family protein n=1 Tax=Marivirga tractuosa (strain ATCC 23168 / DSM 4126 / NBRC 15989 / NCIMB 1408 / VKM B-1430 / H-43) TaxID=643867 RepID=E4TUK9_MARTH|nr:AsmA family protein [Marivirga tractuosa]ADR23102.1 AsmA family protein [Marivirga tractuosa DSM 4126]BDD16224.1 membrane protein [Marivirga tractuosa]
MKKLLIVLGSIIALFVLTIILVPVLFKDRIVSTVQTEIDKSINAKVNFEPAKISISLLSNFPNLTLGVRDFSITGKETFEGDTLFAAKDFSVEMDIVAILKGEPLNIKGIMLDEPLINILVLKDGSANYDITYPSDEQEPVEDTSSEDEFKFGIDHWEIKNGRINYYDQMYDMAISLLGVDHTGNGDFTLSVFDMQTKTTAEDFSFAYDGDVYVAHKTLKADLFLGMDMDNMKFTFKDAKATLNDFHLNFDGYFAMPTDDYDMDINFATTDTEFKNVLSLVPGMYADGFDDLETSGEFDFSGYIKGIYSDTKMPGFAVDLVVRDGFVKAPDVPLPIEKIGLEMHAKSESGDLKDGLLELKNFGLTIDQDRFTAQAVVNNFDSPIWNLSVQGGLNLDIISKIEPSEDFKMGGIITANINSKGSYADVEKEDYGKLQTTGNLKMQNFSYAEKDAPGFSISNADMNFNPESINLTTLNGNYGKSDFTLTGSLSNYIAYAVDDSAVIRGNMKLSSSLLDINEMMGVSEEDVAETTEDTTAMEVVVIPKNIDFTFDATVQTIKYDNFEMKNAVGQIKVKDGILTLDPLKIDMLEGSIKMTGLYNSQDEYEPKFDFQLDISKLSIPETFKNVMTVQKFVPIAEKMQGKFSTDFKIQGLLTQEMMPDLATISGGGLIKIADAAVKDSKVINGVTSLSKLDNTNEVILDDVQVQAEIKDGRLSVKPFDVKMGKYKATVDGSTGLAGDIAYNMQLNVPTGSMGQAANSAISNLLGSKVEAVGSSVNLNFNITGTYDDPKVKLGKTSTEGGSSAAASVKEQVGDRIDEEKEKLKAEVEAQTQAAKDSAKAEAERLKKKAEEEAKKKAEEEKEKLKDKAKGKLKDIFGDGN